MTEKISPERQTAYYVGNAISVIGGLTFVSVFITSAMNFGNFNDFPGQVQSNMIRAILGMVLIVIGQVVSNVGKFGMAGSGLLLDPEKARQDVKPLSEMTGGIIDDTLSAAHLGEHLAGKPDRVVMIKCQACGQLNEETAKFCNQCGRPFTA